MIFKFTLIISLKKLGIVVFNKMFVNKFIDKTNIINGIKNDRALLNDLRVPKSIPKRIYTTPIPKTNISRIIIITAIITLIVFGSNIRITSFFLRLIITQS
jgi:hypothetical protein